MRQWLSTNWFYLFTAITVIGSYLYTFLRHRKIRGNDLKHLEKDFADLKNDNKEDHEKIFGWLKKHEGQIGTLEGQVK